MTRVISDSNGASHFIDSAHQKGDEDALVFVPNGVSVQRSTVLLYFHGDDLRRQKAATLDAFLAEGTHMRDFRAMLRGKHVILVHPWSGAGKADYGWIRGGPSIEPLLDQAIRVASGAAAGAPLPLPMDIIVAGHSRGGSPVRRVATHPARAEYWNLMSSFVVLDGMYGDDDGEFWIKWCRTNKDRHLTVISTSQSSTPFSNANKIAKANLSNTVVKTNIGNVDRYSRTRDDRFDHEKIPQMFFEGYI